MAQAPLSNKTESAMAWDDIRTSPAFPALVGGVAGAVGGVALMLVLNRLGKPKQSLPAAYDSSGNPMNVVYLPTPNQFRILGFTIGDILTLATVGFSLVRQIRDMQQENELKQNLPDAASVPELPPPAAPVPGAPAKK